MFLTLVPERLKELPVMMKMLAQLMISASLVNAEELQNPVHQLINVSLLQLAIQTLENVFIPTKQMVLLAVMATHVPKVTHAKTEFVLEQVLYPVLWTNASNPELATLQLVRKFSKRT
jgi:hypothetical protein